MATIPSPSGRGEMGYADPMRFAPGDLALLAATEEIEIETAATDGSAHRTIIWVMVDGDDAFVRSVRGRPRAGFARRRPMAGVVVHAAGHALPATVEPAADADSIRRTNDALTRKYTGIEGYPEMLEPVDHGHHPPTDTELTAMYFDEFKHQLPDIDPDETDDWLASLDQVVADEGEARARFIIYKLLKRARQLQVGLPPLTQTRYINTISPEQEPDFPGDEQMERRIRRLIRWNAVAMVLRANNRFSGIGGHLATYASAATLYEVGFNHFFRGKDDGGSGDQIFYQGHAAPGHLRSRVPRGPPDRVDQLDHFRRETGPAPGLSSYPHPRLMPEFWEYPTVSMGLGPISAIYQARYNRYLAEPRPARHVRTRASGPSSATARPTSPNRSARCHVASREGLDNLTFVVNCNLQRLDGPVRGNGKIIQELEASFRGAGWNVIKVIWGREWDDLLARDVDGAAGPEDERDRSTASSRSSRSPAARTSASTSSGPTRGCASWSST